MRLAYLYFPRFPVQRRVLEQPSLTGRPLVLHADERGSQRVRFASGAALKLGITPGMTVAAALALEPSLERLPYEPEHEEKALLSLAETLLPLAPGFQRDAPEGLWLDASAASLSGTETRWAERVLNVCRAVGLRGRCVVGAERFTTQALCRWGPGPLIAVPERGGPAVAALPIGCLEEGWLGPGAAAPFRALGLSTLGELAGLPAGALSGRFGASGHLAARLCRGEDDSRFVAEVLPEVLEEQVQLDWPAEQLEPVLFALKVLVDRLCGRLQGRQLAAVRLTVTVALEGGDPLTVPLVLARASAESRLLVELIRHRLTDLTVHQPITTLRLKVDEASADKGRQLALGDAPSGEVELEVVLSRLQSALGEEALFSAAPLASHRPEEAWASAPFSTEIPAPREGGAGGGGGAGPHAGPHAGPRRAASRPPLSPSPGDRQVAEAKGEGRAARHRLAPHAPGAAAAAVQEPRAVAGRARRRRCAALRHARRQAAAGRGAHRPRAAGGRVVEPRALLPGLLPAPARGRGAALGLPRRPGRGLLRAGGL